MEINFMSVQLCWIVPNCREFHFENVDSYFELHRKANEILLQDRA